MIVASSEHDTSADAAAAAITNPNRTIPLIRKSLRSKLLHSSFDPVAAPPADHSTNTETNVTNHTASTKCQNIVHIRTGAWAAAFHLPKRAPMTRYERPH